MIHKQQPVQRAYLQVILPNLHIFAGKDLDLMIFIANRTLRFGKFTERIPLGVIATGVPTLLMLPIPMHKVSIIRKRGRMVDIGLLFYDGKYNEYTINVPGMWYAVRRCFLCVEREENVAALFYLMDQVCQIFPYADVPIISEEFDNMSDIIEERVKIGLERSQRSKSRKRRERMQKPLKHQHVRDFMVECCGEYGSRYSDGGLTRQDGYHIKAFLKNMGESDQDPRRILREACQFWSDFCRSLKNDQGGSMVLPDAVSWRIFFKHHIKIMAWLATEKDSVQHVEYVEEEVIDLRGK